MREYHRSQRTINAADGQTHPTCVATEAVHPEIKQSSLQAALQQNACFVSAPRGITVHSKPPEWTVTGMTYS